MSNHRNGSASESRPTISRLRDDIDLANTWVVSDTHFGHDNIVGFCHRPEDHEQVMIAEWRKYVPDDATVIHLGDLCYKGNGRFKNIIAPELVGARKLLIAGNHDRQRFSFYRDCGFKLARPFSIPVIEGTDGFEVFTDAVEIAKLGAKELTEFMASYHGAHLVSFNHYQWSDEQEQRPMNDRDVRLHGHIHNSGYTREGFVPFLRGHINLSLEQTKYRPVNLKALLDGAILGRYTETTEESLAEARDRKEANRA